MRRLLDFIRSLFRNSMQFQIPQSQTEMLMEFESWKRRYRRLMGRSLEILRLTFDEEGKARIETTVPEEDPRTAVLEPLRSDSLAQEKVREALDYSDPGNIPRLILSFLAILTLIVTESLLFTAPALLTGHYILVITIFLASLFGITFLIIISLDDKFSDKRAIGRFLIYKILQIPLIVLPLAILSLIILRTKIIHGDAFSAVDMTNEALNSENSGESSFIMYSLMTLLNIVAYVGALLIFSKIFSWKSFKRAKIFKYPGIKRLLLIRDRVSREFDRETQRLGRLDREVRQAFDEIQSIIDAYNASLYNRKLSLRNYL